VFRGGCTLEAAEQVGEADLDVLQSLVDKSLVRHTGTRFWMLETIREYAAERLEESGEAHEIRCRHAEHVLALVRETSSDLDRGRKLALDRVEAELDNIRTGLRWALDGGRVALALDLAGELGSFWIHRDHEPEARRWLEEALFRGTDVPDTTRAKGLASLGEQCVHTGDARRATVLYAEALALYQSLGDEGSVAAVSERIGDAAHSLGEFERARVSLEESLAIAERIGDPVVRLAALHHLGQVERDSGDRKRARELLERAASGAQELDNPTRLASILHSLGDLELDDGHVGAAEAAFTVALETALAADADRPMLYCIGGLAATAAARSRFDRAGQLWGALEQLQHELGLPIHSSERQRYERAVGTMRNEPAFVAGIQVGRCFQLEQAVAYALSGD
jgi:tetratricopeptide (TPR) repeat protein